MKIKNTNNYNVCFTKDKQAFILEPGAEVMVKDYEFDSVKDVSGIIKIQNKKGDE